MSTTGSTSNGTSSSSFEFPQEAIDLAKGTVKQFKDQRGTAAYKLAVHILEKLDLLEFVEVRFPDCFCSDHWVTRNADGQISLHEVNPSFSVEGGKWDSIGDYVYLDGGESIVLPVAKVADSCWQVSDLLERQAEYLKWKGEEEATQKNRVDILEQQLDRVIDQRDRSATELREARECIDRVFYGCVEGEESLSEPILSGYIDEDEDEGGFEAVIRLAEDYKKLVEWKAKHTSQGEACPFTGKTHYLKTDPTSFECVFSGDKTFEVRKNDRDYNVGDHLLLKETKCSAEWSKIHSVPLQYTGRTTTVRIKHISSGGIYGIEKGWCVMSIEPVNAVPAQEGNVSCSGCCDSGD